MTDEFEKESIDYMLNTDIAYRKSLGQYFTPRSVREALVELLPRDVKNPRILDPACGTGEFLITAKQYFDVPTLEGWDIDPVLTAIGQKLIPDADFVAHDSLDIQTDKKYDFIIGNPPYFELRLSPEQSEKYSEIRGGRTNIFSLFVYSGLNMLKEGGYLAFVIPPSMNNGAYFHKLRQYIIKHANIEHIKVLHSADLFHKAQQLTMIMVLKKGKNRGDYIFRHNGLEIFSERWKFLERSFRGKQTLHDLGYTVKTGRLIWNENRDKLSSDPTDTALIWSHNITNKGLVLDNKAGRMQYVTTEQPDVGPAIVVNRVTGAGKSARIRCALIPKGFQFIAENHVNVIFPPKKRSQLTLSQLLGQLQSAEGLEVMQNITGNTQISKTELEKLFPIDL